MLFVLERESGRPVFPVEERRVPASDIPDEQASPTQPFTSFTPPLSPHRLTNDQIWGVSDADRAACRAVMAPLRNEGIFTPPSTQGTLLIPARIGGANWGRVAIDPARQIAVVAVNRIAEMVQLIPRDGFDLARARATEQTRLGDDFEYNMMRGTPYVMRRRLLLAPSRLPCTPPPFGTLVAIDLRTGQKKWDVPLGSMTAVLTPDIAAHTQPDWGSVNLGGAVAGEGVVFAGGALDRRLHAYDIDTGREVWSAELPASAKATPMVYRVESGAEHVAVAVGGGGAWGAGDYVIAFRVATPSSKP
jgi:quinoprotein glucose dehydrogenase